MLEHLVIDFYIGSQWYLLIVGLFLAKVCDFYVKPSLIKSTFYKSLQTNAYALKHLLQIASFDKTCNTFIKPLKTVLLVRTLTTAL